MYTEEEEFNYDDYLDEKDTTKSNKPFIDFRFILKVILIIILVILIIFLVFKIKNKNSSSNNQKQNTTKDVGIVFDSNMDMVSNVAYEYFFYDGNLPNNIGDSNSVTLKKLMEENKVSKVVDSKGNACGYNTSEAIITKYKNYYQLEVKLICSEKRDTKIFYYGLDGKCLNCNGEIFVPEEENKDENTISETDLIEEKEVEEDIYQEDSIDKVPVKVCKDYSEWSTEYVAGSNYDRETRTLVRGFKEEIQYGNWSEPTTTVIAANDALEVKSYTQTETVTKQGEWSKESTSKPSSKEGREISSRTKTKTSTTTSCTKDTTYTRTLTKWDNSAYSCKIIKLGQVECTYVTKGTCTPVTTTKKVTYYKYRDTITEEVTKTYYQARTIQKNVVYTGYVLESEMPEGYTKLAGSEKVEYRYREKCDK